MDIQIKFYSPKETIKKKDFIVRAWLAGSPSTYYEIDIQKDKKNSKSAYLGSIPDDSFDFDIHFPLYERIGRAGLCVHSTTAALFKIERVKI